jgi:thiol-disulfide isomerase/thioredoxin
MKKIIIISLGIFFITSCDKIPPRIPPPAPDCILNAPIVKTNTLTSNTRKVLLEDFTGHTCGNCPPAAVKAEQLYKSYNGNLIVIANHVSKTFAAPKTLAYFEDFRDPASTDWDVFFSMSASGLPKGTVNRMLIGDKYPQNFSSWEGNVLTEINKPQTVKLDITTKYDPTQKLLNVKVFTRFLNSFSNDVNLIMVLTQDSIVSDQTDYTPPSGSAVVDGDRRPDYRFDHIMVKSLNGSWGQLLKSAPIAANDTITKIKDCNIASKCFYKDQICSDDNHLYLVVFACNNVTKEVLQVEKLKIR